MRMSLKECMAQMFLAALLCCVVWPAFAQEAAPTPQMDEDSARAIREQLDKRMQEKVKKLKEEPRIKKAHEYLLELEDIYKSKGKEAAKEYSDRRRLKISDDMMVRVDIYLTIPAESFDTLLFESYGGKINGKLLGVIDALIPIGKIRDIIDNLTGIEYMEVPRRPVPMSESEGVQKTGAYAYHTAQPTAFTGQFTKIAVIDVGFGGLQSAMNNGELPSGMTMIDCKQLTCLPTTFSTEPALTKTDVHGTAVAEIVYDMARSAQLFLIKYDTKRDLMVAVEYCHNNGINIINHSVAWYDSNFFNGKCLNTTTTQYDNPVCAANKAKEYGILWAQAAGNSAQRHYEETYLASNTN